MNEIDAANAALIRDIEAHREARRLKRGGEPARSPASEPASEPAPEREHGKGKK